MLAPSKIPNHPKEVDHVPVSRRKFLKSGTIVSLSVVIPLNNVISALGQQTETDQQGLFKIPVASQADGRLSEENFSRYLYSTFRIDTSPLTAINLQLIEVTRSKSSSEKQPGKTAKLDSFSIVFRGPQNLDLESKTYRLTHDQMGVFELFISPVNDRKKERLYQAVFTRFQS